jgi:hypothetical protein
MKPLILFLVFSASTFGANLDYIAKMITCEEHEEQMVAHTFDVFLALKEGRELPAGVLRFPSRLAERSNAGAIISRTFYVSPNEVRGFELFVPAHCIAEKEGVLVSSVALVVGSQETKQGITCIALKARPPSPTTAPAGSTRPRT